MLLQLASPCLVDGSGSRCHAVISSSGEPDAMAELHKRARRHPKYKTAYHVRNWPSYDQTLRARGDVTLWLSEAVITHWRAPPSGRRGGQQKYSDLAIQTALTLRLLFHLPLRQTEGFLCSIFRLSGLDLPVPEHTTLSRGRPQPAKPDAPRQAPKAHRVYCTHHPHRRQHRTEDLRRRRVAQQEARREITSEVQIASYRCG